MHAHEQPSQEILSTGISGKYTLFVNQTKHTGMIRMKRLLPFFAALLGLLPCALSANIPSDSIPFELGTASRIYVQCRVNDSRPLLFLFDTGATSMVINSNSLEGIPMEFNETIVNYGATGSNEVRKSAENKFSVGKQSLSGVPFIAIPYARDQWDGVLGLWFIQRRSRKSITRTGKSTCIRTVPTRRRRTPSA